ncbi:MAG: hypothetical protein KGM98_02985 [Bacteroidota bacterium]|nr:hypothetical protein [Bacteroidota bacterium]
MTKIFKNLSLDDQELLLKVPVLISLYVSSSDHIISKKERADAVKFAHIKSFSSIPSLIIFYKELDLNFQSIFEQQSEKYYPFDEVQRRQLNQDISDTLIIAKKLDPTVEKELLDSFSEYAKNVKKATRGDLINFLIPLPLPGLTD